MIDTWSETHRHRCEVRYILLHRVHMGRQWAHDFLDRIERARGKAARQRLEADILDQWSRGNRGEPGCWFDQPVA